MAGQSPVIYLAQMDNELEEMNNAIASRRPGERLPARGEVENRRTRSHTCITESGLTKWQLNKKTGLSNQCVNQFRDEQLAMI